MHIPSTPPGAHERHLLRTTHCPLLSASSEADAEKLRLAREEDEKERMAAEQALHLQLKQAAEFEKNVDAEDVIALRDELEKLYSTICGIGGDQEKHKQAIIRMIGLIYLSLRNAADNDHEALERIDNDERLTQSHLHIHRFPIISDILRDTPVINEDEFLPSLLCEEEEALYTVLHIFSPEQLAQMKQLAEELVAKQGLESQFQHKIMLIQTVILEHQKA